MSSGIYVINVRSVAAEQFGDELVVIQFDSGKYYSLGGLAVQVWELLHAPVAITSIINALADAAGATSPGDEALTREVQDLGKQFAAEGLITEAEAPGVTPTLAAFQYAPATVEIYSDLADLVSIDPVHDVDAMIGWPRTGAA